MVRAASLWLLLVCLRVTRGQADGTVIPESNTDVWGRFAPAIVSLSVSSLTCIAAVVVNVVASRARDSGQGTIVVGSRV